MLPVCAEDSDEQIVLAAKGGDLAAMDFLLDKYRSFVCLRARNFFIVGADREDVVQEGMIGLFKAVRDFKVEKLPNFRAFADLCITRQIITALKTATRQKHVPLNSGVSLSKPLYSDGNDTLLDVLESPRSVDPADAVIQREEQDAVRNRMREKLSSFERSVLALYLDGKTYREISDVLERHPKSVDNALQRIKRKIERHLERSMAVT